MVTTIILRYNDNIACSHINEDLKIEDSLHCSRELNVS